MTGTIFDIKRYAIHDGPGIRTTVFFKGCPLRCRWCHNPESWRSEPELSIRAGRCTLCGRCVEVCRQGAASLAGGSSSTDPAKCTVCGLCVEACPAAAREIIGRQVSVEELMAMLCRDIVFYDESGGGVTISGGEPLAQGEFLGKLLRHCKAEGIHTALDTSCHAPWPKLEAVEPLVDLFLCDLKMMDPARHEQTTGVSNRLILANLVRLSERGRPMVIRVPLVAGVNDDEANIAASGRFAASLASVAQIDLLPYNKAVRGKSTRLAEGYDLPLFERPGRQRVEEIAERLRGFDLEVKIGG